MFCTRCGTRTPGDGARFCSDCGATLMISQISDEDAVLGPPFQDTTGPTSPDSGSRHPSDAPGVLQRSESITQTAPASAATWEGSTEPASARRNLSRRRLLALGLLSAVVIGIAVAFVVNSSGGSRSAGVTNGGTGSTPAPQMTRAKACGIELGSIIDVWYNNLNSGGANTVAQAIGILSPLFEMAGPILGQVVQDVQFHGTSGAEIRLATDVTTACTQRGNPILDAQQLSGLTNISNSADAQVLRTIDVYGSPTSEATSSGPPIATDTPEKPYTTPTPTRPNVTGPLSRAFQSAVPVAPQQYMGAHANALFLTPSRNIACFMVTDGGDFVDCFIEKYTFPQPGAHCPVGLVVSIEAGKLSKPSCYKDHISMESGVLPYGRSVTNGNFACVSRPEGVSCVDLTTGTGFTLSRDKYTPVP